MFYGIHANIQCYTLFVDIACRETLFQVLLVHFISICFLYKADDV